MNVAIRRKLAAAARATGTLCASLSALCVLLAFTPANANEQDEAAFFKGKQMRIVVGAAAGTGYDLVARIVARHLGAHIPGHPSIIVQNLPGAGSLQMTNQLYNSGARDGTVIGAAINGMPTAPLLQPNAAHFDPTKLDWLGSTNREAYVAFVWHTAPVQSLSDLKAKELIVGGTTAGTSTIDFPLVARSFLGLKFKIIRGYEGTPQLNAAVERGEIQGNGGVGWFAVKAQSAQWLADRSIKIIAQYGFVRHRDLPDVPTMLELARGDADVRALKLVFARQEYGRPYFLPPGVPAERLQLLRRAFDACMEDPTLLADAEKLQLEIDPMTGEEVAALVAQVADTPRDLVARVRAALESPEP